MAHGISHRSSLKRETKELNLVPIMNLFIVIIPILIKMLVTYTLAMLYIASWESSGNQGGNSTTETPAESEEVKEKPIFVYLEIRPNSFSLITKENDKEHIPEDDWTASSYDYEGLVDALTAIDEKYRKPEDPDAPGKNSRTNNYLKVYLDNYAPVEAFIRAMDKANSAGFTKLTLVEAGAFMTAQ